MQQLIEDMIYVAKLEARIEEIGKLLPFLPSDMQKSCRIRVTNLKNDKQSKLEKIRSTSLSLLE